MIDHGSQMTFEGTDGIIMIELIRERPYLYDTHDPDHANSTMVANAWMALTEKMGLKNGGKFHGPPVSALGV